MSSSVQEAVPKPPGLPASSASSVKDSCCPAASCQFCSMPCQYVVVFFKLIEMQDMMPPPPPPDRIKRPLPKPLEKTGKAGAERG